jgi:hypothetical protein
MMRLRSFGEREGARDLRFDSALCPQVQKLIGPLALARRPSSAEGATADLTVMMRNCGATQLLSARHDLKFKTYADDRPRGDRLDRLR